MCGYQADDFLLSSQDEDEDSGLRQKTIIEEFDDADLKKRVMATQKKKDVKIRAPEKSASQKQFPPSGEVTIKEIDSWTFSFSESDDCIYAGTPALYPFRLKLGHDDLEELLEFLTKETGRVKKVPQVSGRDVRDVVEMVDEIIEEKKASVKITFSQVELAKIAAIINEKLQSE